MVKDGIQNYPTSDSPNHDAFEGIVELYYEIKGYITSSGKWFWKKSDGKYQGGYQDIDVLAINGKETIIVSVSSNFDDKLNFSKGKINETKLIKTLDHFNRIEEYLNATNEYKWLMEGSRKIKRVLAVINAPKGYEKYSLIPETKEIEIVQVKEMITVINNYLEKYKKQQNENGLKTQNQTFRILQILNEKKMFTK